MDMGLMELQATWVHNTHKAWNIVHIRLTLLSKKAELTWTTFRVIRMFGETTDPKQKAQNNLTVASLETILRRSHHLSESYSPQWQLQLREEASTANSLIQEMKDIFSSSRMRFVLEKLSEESEADFAVNQWLQLAILLSWNNSGLSALEEKFEDRIVGSRLINLSLLLVESGLKIQSTFCNVMKPFIAKFRKLRRTLKIYKAQLSTNQEQISIFPYSDIPTPSLEVIVQCKEAEASYTISVDNKIVTVEWQAGPNQCVPTTSRFSLEVKKSCKVTGLLLESILKHTLDRIEDTQEDIYKNLPNAQAIAMKLLASLQKLVNQMDRQHKKKRIRVSTCSKDTRQAIFLVEMSLKDLNKMVVDIIQNTKTVVGVADVMHSKLIAGRPTRKNSLLPKYSSHLSKISSRWPWTLGLGWKQRVHRFREGCLIDAEYLMSHTLLSKYAVGAGLSISGSGLLFSPQLCKQLLLCKTAKRRSSRFKREIQSIPVPLREDISTWSLPEGPLAWDTSEFESMCCQSAEPMKTAFHYVNPSIRGKVEDKENPVASEQTITHDETGAEEQDSSTDTSAHIQDQIINKDTKQE